MNGPFPAPPGYLLLHAVRLKGLADVPALAAATGLRPPEVEAGAAALEADGLVVRRTGVVAGWALTVAGRDRHSEDLAAELAAADCRDAVESAYHRLLALNEPFKALCTSWQLCALDPPVVNHHTDAAYDAGVVEGLVAIHGQAGPVVDALAAELARFGRYRPRFESALARIAGGEVGYFTRPLIDSYHDVWMELHEDLLATLGIDRREGST